MRAAQAASRGHRFRRMVPVSTPSVELSPVRVCGRYHFPFARGGLFSSRYRHQPQVAVSADWRRPLIGDPMQSYGAEKGMDCDFSETQMLKCVNGCRVADCVHGFGEGGVRG